MTRKDYIALAAALKAARDTIAFQDAALAAPSGAKWYAAHVAANIARVLAADNPRFDRDRFMRAAGES